MILKLFREVTENKGTFGYLFFDGHFICYSLENAEKIIPAGTYELELYSSPKNKRIVPLLKNVPNRNMIEIHIANYPSELEGCIAVGLIMEPSNERILSSTIAFDKLMSKIRSKPQTEFKIIIEQI